jgi:hypothetical protein
MMETMTYWLQPLLTRNLYSSQVFYDGSHDLLTIATSNKESLLEVAAVNKSWFHNKRLDYYKDSLLEVATVNKSWFPS